MIFKGEFQEDEVWAEGEERESKLVFIGKNLDKEQLKVGFAACVVTPYQQEKKRKLLRFAVGDTVECKVGCTWKKGEVKALMYRDDSMPPGIVAPYSVQLEKGGTRVYAPADE